MCFSIGTPKIINFPFVPNGKLIILGVPQFRHITVSGTNGKLIILGVPKFRHITESETNGKLITLGVPVLRHITVSTTKFIIKNN